jgi:hypothetical protein
MSGSCCRAFLKIYCGILNAGVDWRKELADYASYLKGKGEICPAMPEKMVPVKHKEIKMKGWPLTAEDIQNLLSKETGLRMAVALVATFYGLLISNLVLNPLGEWLIEELKKDEVKAEISIETIGLIMDDANMVEIQEKLNSYLDVSERIHSLEFNIAAEAL